MILVLIVNCFLFLCSSAASVAANTTVHDLCAAETAALYDRGDAGKSNLETALYKFVDLLHDSCRSNGTACNLPNDDDFPPRFIKTLNYTPLANTSVSYADYVRECEEDGSGSTVLCTMDAEYASVQGSPAGIVSIFDSTTTRFRGVPVCVPTTCTASDEEMKTALPVLFQNFENSSATTTVAFTCPSGDAVADGSCENDLPLIKHSAALEYYSSTSSRLFLDVAESCFTEAFVGTPSDTCSIDVDDPDAATLRIDLEEISNEKEYKKYRKACIKAKGEFCAASISVEFPGSTGGYSYFNVSVRNFPFCYAQSCEGGDFAKNVAMDFFFVMGVKLLSNGNVRHLSPVAETASMNLFTTGTGGRSLGYSLGEMMERRCGGEDDSRCKFEVDNFVCDANGTFIDQKAYSGASIAGTWSMAVVVVAIAGFAVTFV